MKARQNPHREKGRMNEFLFLFLATHVYYAMTFQKEHVSWWDIFLVEFNTACLCGWTYWICLDNDDMTLQWMYLPFLYAWADVWVYTVHRLFHSRRLFRYIHYIHHKRIYPQPYDAFYAHPLENFLQNWCLVYLPTLVLPLSRLSIFLMLVSVIASALTSHDTILGKFHYLHHQFHHTNYGAAIHVMDRLFKTYSDLPVLSPTHHIVGIPSS